MNLAIWDGSTDSNQWLEMESTQSCWLFFFLDWGPITKGVKLSSNVGKIFVCDCFYIGQIMGPSTSNVVTNNSLWIYIYIYYIYIYITHDVFMLVSFGSQQLNQSCLMSQMRYFRLYFLFKMNIRSSLKKQMNFEMKWKLLILFKDAIFVTNFSWIHWKVRNEIFECYMLALWIGGG